MPGNKRFGEEKNEVQGSEVWPMRLSQITHRSIADVPHLPAWIGAGHFNVITREGCPADMHLH